MEKLIQRFEGVEIYQLADGTYEARTAGLKPVKAATYEEVFKAAIEWLE